MRFPPQTKLLSLLLSFIIICNLVRYETKGSCNQKDKQILLCFKHGLTDPSHILSSWSDKEDCCEWRGVLCDINGRVINLSLRCITYGDNKTHCLSGEFHLSLFELEFLNYLDLSNHDFKAIHSPLDCQNMSLVNPLHRSGNFSNVVYLDLSYNENLVVDDLRWLLRLSSSLEYLNLNSLNLHKQTQWFQILTMLPSLSELYMSNCLLENASPSVLRANFTSLENIDLSYNDFFSEMPIWLFNLSRLSYLDLGNNRFYGQIPETLSNLRNLHGLYLGGNKLNGTIPNGLGQLAWLSNLDLSMNLLTSVIPTTLWNLSSLLSLDLSSNNLTGVVSDRNFAKHSKLRELGLGSPSIVFDFESHWMPPFKLQRLDLQYADVKLLPWLYTQESLTTLKIEYSFFKNVSQDMFWSLANNCAYLYLTNNNMTWDISNVLLNSNNVVLDGNGLSGDLPKLTANVRVFRISGNNLSGSLSSLLCQNMKEKNNLKYLDVSNNYLSGELTECWKNWKSLVHVDLRRNNLTGMIPPSMGTLSNLLSPHIYNNKLHGEIPVSLKSLPKLVIVNLGRNKISGNISNWIGHDIKVLQLRSNEFSGDIPLQICQLSSLMVLDLASNRLTGTIPHCLHNITAMISNNTLERDEFKIIINLPSIGFLYSIEVPLLAKGIDLNYYKYMRVIDFSNNHLSGRIPLEVFSLTALQSLNLSQNQLIGNIPEEIGNMKALESLDFSNNTLSGEIPQTMSSLSFLEVLNLSFNNFQGQIPLGTQLQGFSNLSYIGNPQLCGTPLIEKCNNNEAPGGGDTKLMENEEEESEVMQWFYMGMGVGFATSFWIVFGTLLFKRTWRHAYFNFLYDVKDWFMSRWF
ncbi:receptor-like protein EIX2 [Vicia villosa]|uniref:receptor-like protein EIX2 n=1 Tax=Vicia villosa TaxID=3911 RepID=UPI00273C9CC0|nr:receptor-like protein EIX2 [Vicia villosa]